MKSNWTFRCLGWTISSCDEPRTSYIYHYYYIIILPDMMLISCTNTTTHTITSSLWVSPLRSSENITYLYIYLFLWDWNHTTISQLFYQLIKELYEIQIFSLFMNQVSWRRRFIFGPAHCLWSNHWSSKLQVNSLSPHSVSPDPAGLLQSAGFINTKPLKASSSLWRFSSEGFPNKKRDGTSVWVTWSR